MCRGLHRPGIEPGANGPHEARFGLNRARLATINFTTKPTVRRDVRQNDVLFTIAIVIAMRLVLLIPGFEPGTFRVLSGRYNQLTQASII